MGVTSLEKTLKELGSSQIMTGVLLLNPDRKPFLIEDLQRRFRRASEKYPRLKGSADNDGMIDIFFFFFDNYLYYDFGLPDYRLSDEGVRLFREQFNSYPSKEQEAITEVAREVWK